MRRDLFSESPEIEDVAVSRIVVLRRRFLMRRDLFSGLWYEACMRKILGINVSTILWKQKVMEEFVDVVGIQGVVHWKERLLSIGRVRRLKETGLGGKGFPGLSGPSVMTLIDCLRKWWFNGRAAD